MSPIGLQNHTALRVPLVEQHAQRRPTRLRLSARNLPAYAPGLMLHNEGLGAATGVGLFQNRHNLRFGELRLALGTSWLGWRIMPESSP